MSRPSTETIIPIRSSTNNAQNTETHQDDAYQPDRTLCEASEDEGQDSMSEVSSLEEGGFEEVDKAGQVTRYKGPPMSAEEIRAAEAAREAAVLADPWYKENTQRRQSRMSRILRKAVRFLTSLPLS